jgi:pimeloyl-[acyl-carrier protein] synthase
MTTSLRALGYDPMSEHFRRDPYPAYRRLQQEAPRFYDEQRRMWVLSRYADVRFVLHDPRFQFVDPSHVNVFDEPSFRSIQVLPPSTQRLMLQRRKAFEMLGRFLETTHPSKHAVLRQMIQPWFSASALRSMQEWLQHRAHELIDKFHTAAVRGTGAFDIVEGFAYPITHGALCRLLGLTNEAAFHYTQEVRDIIIGTDVAASQERKERQIWAIHKLGVILAAELDSDAAHSGSLLAHLSKMQKAGVLHEDDLLSVTIELFFAGLDSSYNTISLAVHNLLRHRNAWEDLRAAPERIPSAFEELLRFESTVQARPHVALEDVDIDGWHIRRGDRFHLLIGAANRDPAQFERADELVLDRSPNPHLGFLHGIHYCIGAPLARMTLQIGLRVLLERMPNLRLVENGETRLPMYFVRGFEHLLVTEEP